MVSLLFHNIICLIQSHPHPCHHAFIARLQELLLFENTHLRMSSKSGYFQLRSWSRPLMVYFFGFLTAAFPFAAEDCTACFSAFFFFFGGLCGVLSPISISPFQAFYLYLYRTSNSSKPQQKTVLRRKTEQTHPSGHGFSNKIILMINEKSHA
jgi:hypothetical protein